MPDSAPEGSELELVELDRDHPGFRDAEYRARRNAIARLAREHRHGDPIIEVDYSEVEHGVWRVALEQLAPLHARHACRQYLAGWPLLGIDPGRVPRFADVNRALAATTGFSLVPVAGLVAARVFLTYLASGTFLATQYVRHHSRPLYTPEPDIIHELIGHAALLASPEFAALNRLFGRAAERADEAEMEALIRVYWYTLEFGVVRAGERMEVIGAGLLSSSGELGGFETQPQLLPFDIPTIAATPFDPTDYQKVLFVGASTEDVLARLTDWLEGILARPSDPSASRAPALADPLGAVNLTSLAASSFDEQRR
jgi:phenylalanine-4-hydroxylase